MLTLLRNYKIFTLSNENRVALSHW